MSVLIFNHLIGIYGYVCLIENYPTELVDVGRLVFESSDNAFMFKDCDYIKRILFIPNNCNQSIPLIIEFCFQWRQILIEYHTNPLKYERLIEMYMWASPPKLRMRGRLKRNRYIKTNFVSNWASTMKIG